MPINDELSTLMTIKIKEKIQKQIQIKSKEQIPRG